MTRNTPAIVFGALIALTLGIAGIALATHFATYRWPTAPIAAEAKPVNKVEPPPVDAAGAADELAARLSHSDAKVRRKAAYALGQLKVTTDPVINGLVKAISDADNDVADTALEALELIGPAAAPKLYRLVADSKGPTRERVLTALEKIGSPPKEKEPRREALNTVALLVSRDPSASIRHQALRHLVQFGEDAAPVYGSFLARIKREDYAQLLKGIGMLGPKAKAALPALQDHLAKELVRTKSPLDEDTLRIFKNCGPVGASSLAVVLKGLEGKAVADPVRQSVLKGIGQMGADAKPAVPMLIALLQSNAKEKANFVRRSDLLVTLGDIGPAASDAIPAVRALTKDSALAAEASVALRRMGVIDKK